MDKRKIGTLAAVAMLAFAACSGGGGGGGGSKGEIEIWSSLPRQGSSKAQTDTIVNAINLAIEEKKGVAGGYTINAEMIAQAAAAKLRIREAPVSHRPRHAGHSKIRLADVAFSLTELWAVRRGLSGKVQLAAWSPVPPRATKLGGEG